MANVGAGQRQFDVRERLAAGVARSHREGLRLVALKGIDQPPFTFGPVGLRFEARAVAADVAMRLLGQGGVVFVSLTVMLSTLGTLNGSVLTNPRVFFAMAADGLLFRKIAAVHPTYQTPYVAIILAAILGIVFVMMQTFEQLADTFVTAILPFYALGVASIFVFRRRGYSPPFRTPLYPVTPLLFIAATAYLMVNALIDDTSRWPTLGIFGVILAGVPLYYLTVGRPRAGGAAVRAAGD